MNPAPILPANASFLHPVVGLRTRFLRPLALCLSLAPALLAACGEEDPGASTTAGDTTAASQPDVSASDATAGGSGPDTTAASDTATADAGSDASPPSDASTGYDVVVPADDATSTDDTSAAPDADADAVPDDRDNCLGLFNPGQDDRDADGAGDACDATNDDTDGDRIPNTADPFPSDAARPGQAAPNTVYAHTAVELFRMDVKTMTLVSVGRFRFPAGSASANMTDIAIDRHGVIWGVSFNDIFIVHPVTAECWRIGALPRSFNGLSHIPGAAAGQTEDLLVGISVEGEWWRLTLNQGASSPTVSTTLMGSYGGGWRSSGDVFSIVGVGTFGAVDQNGNDQLVEVDPTTGAVTRLVGELGGTSSVFGLAGWSGRVFAFDETGELLALDVTTGAITSRTRTPHAWWGAGVRTVIVEE